MPRPIRARTNADRMPRFTFAGRGCRNSRREPRRAPAEPVEPDPGTGSRRG